MNCIIFMNTDSDIDSFNLADNVAVQQQRHHRAIAPFSKIAKRKFPNKNFYLHLTKLYLISIAIGKK